MKRSYLLLFMLTVILSVGGAPTAVLPSVSMRLILLQAVRTTSNQPWPVEIMQIH